MRQLYFALFTLALLLVMVSQTYGQSFPSSNYNPCEADPDRWAIREPTPAEEEEYGRGVLVFEYWNSVSKCSNQMTRGIYYDSPIYGELRFELSVQVLGRDFNEMERISLDTYGTPYVSYTEYLMLHDGEEPGAIILYPQLY